MIRSSRIHILLILLIALVLRLVNLNQSFWLDEAAQMIESTRPFLSQFQIAADFHPPLFHLLMHFWLKAGQSEIYARIPVVALGVLSVFLLYKIALLFTSKKSALAAALLLSFSPFHIYYSQEVRPYMLFAFLSLVSIYYWLKLDFKKYLIANVFLLYSNYFATFLFLGQTASDFLVRKKTLNKTLKSLFLSYLFLLPWLPSLIEQISVGLGSGFSGWKQIVSESYLRLIPLTFAKFIIGKVSFDNNLVYLAVITPSFFVFAASGFLVKKSLAGRVLLSLFFSSLFFAFLISVFLPVAAPQRLIFLLPVFYLIIAKGFEFMDKKNYIISFSIILATSIIGLFYYFSDTRFQRENWRESVSHLRKSAGSDHLVLFSFPEPFAPFLWYNSSKLNAKGIAPEFAVTDKDLVVINPDVISREKIYYYGYLTDLTDPEKKVDRYLNSAGFRQISIKNFPGVGFVYEYQK